MKSFLVGAAIIVALSVAYILSFRVNNKGKKKGCSSKGCGGCSGCAVEKTGRE